MKIYADSMTSRMKKLKTFLLAMCNNICYSTICVTYTCMSARICCAVLMHVWVVQHCTTWICRYAHTVFNSTTEASTELYRVCHIMTNNGSLRQDHTYEQTFKNISVTFQLWNPLPSMIAANLLSGILKVWPTGVGHFLYVVLSETLCLEDTSAGIDSGVKIEILLLIALFKQAQ